MLLWQIKPKFEFLRGEIFSRFLFIFYMGFFMFLFFISLTFKWLQENALIKNILYGCSYMWMIRLNILNFIGIIITWRNFQSFFFYIFCVDISYIGNNIYKVLCCVSPTTYNIAPVVYLNKRVYSAMNDVSHSHI